MSVRNWCFASGASTAVICWAGLAAAYRPFDGTDAGVANFHEVELEVGPLGYRQEGSSRFLAVPALVANYGFAPGFEVVAEGRQDVPLRALHPRSEVQDLAVSVKSVLRAGSLQQRAGLSVALEVGMHLPAFERDWGAHIGSIFSYRFPGITLHLNLVNDMFSPLRYEAGASLILEGPDDWRIRPVAELLAERTFGQSGIFGGLAESMLVGSIARLSDTLSFDAAGRLGHFESQRETEIRAGLTWSFELSPGDEPR